MDSFDHGPTSARTQRDEEEGREPEGRRFVSAAPQADVPGTGSRRPTELEAEMQLFEEFERSQHTRDRDMLEEFLVKHQPENASGGSSAPSPKPGAGSDEEDFILDPMPSPPASPSVDQQPPESPDTGGDSDESIPLASQLSKRIKNRSSGRIRADQQPHRAGNTTGRRNRAGDKRPINSAGGNLEPTRGRHLPQRPMPNRRQTTPRQGDLFAIPPPPPLPVVHHNDLPALSPAELFAIPPPPPLPRHRSPALSPAELFAIPPPPPLPRHRSPAELFAIPPPPPLPLGATLVPPPTDRLARSPPSPPERKVVRFKVDAPSPAPMDMADDRMEGTPGNGTDSDSDIEITEVHTEPTGAEALDDDIIFSSTGLNMEGFALTFTDRLSDALTRFRPTEDKLRRMADTDWEQLEPRSLGEQPLSMMHISEFLELARLERERHAVWDVLMSQHAAVVKFEQILETLE